MKDSGNPLSSLLSNTNRTQKPREEGITVLIDTGHGNNRIEDLAQTAGPYCDSVKIAWASSLITGDLEGKLDLYRRHDIAPLLGGSLFEWAYLWGKLDPLMSIVKNMGCAIEISDGVATIPRAERLKWIETFASFGVVFSELGGKLSSHELNWEACAKEELAAGAKYVVIEGREIGPVGKELREDLVDRILNAIEPSKILFEALERYQQVFFINRVGPNVNLGNIRFEHMMVLECYRRGLKEQTMLQTLEKFGR